MKLLYIGGAYRALTVWGMWQNIQLARETSLQVLKLNIETGVPAVAVLCPHANTALFDGELPDAQWLTIGIELLRRCDAMLLVPGWFKSDGTQAEIAWSRQNGRLVFEDITEVRAWLGLPLRTEVGTSR